MVNGSKPGYGRPLALLKGIVCLWY